MGNPPFSRLECGMGNMGNGNDGNTERSVKKMPDPPKIRHLETPSG
jgi:hypothetical protein